MFHFYRRRGSIDRSSKGSESHPMTDVSVNDAYDTIRPDNEDSQPKTRKGAERGMYFSSGQAIRCLRGSAAFKRFPPLVKNNVVGLVISDDLFEEFILIQQNPITIHEPSLASTMLEPRIVMPWRPYWSQKTMKWRQPTAFCFH